MIPCKDCHSNNSNQGPMTQKISAAQRYQICESCEHLSSTLKVCEKCSCFMIMKVKLKWEKCPIGKW